jgi:hypothetical protein
MRRSKPTGCQKQQRRHAPGRRQDFPPHAVQASTRRRSP